MARSRPRRVLAGLLALLVGGLTGHPPPRGEAAELPAPAIVSVAVQARPRAGAPGEARIAYRAPGANVVAVVQTIEDLDGPVLRRTARQRQINVLVHAFGREAGEVAIPLAFATPGRKRVTHVLVADERVESDPAVVEVDVEP